MITRTEIKLGTVKHKMVIRCQEVREQVAEALEGQLLLEAEVIHNDERSGNRSQSFQGTGDRVRMARSHMKKKYRTVRNIVGA